MAKTAVASEELANKFATEKDTPYLRWVRGEGLDIISAHFVPNLRTVALKPWPRRGGSGVFINHEASRTSNDCYVCEIAPRGKLEPQRQLYEEMILVLDGRGSTTVWNDAGDRIAFEWKAGAMFAIPLNTWHQHFNGSGTRADALRRGDQLPEVINLYDDLDFVFNTAYDFKDRFAGEPDYFSAKGEQKGFLLTTNFVPDAVNLPLISRQGARRRRRPHPLQHGEGHDREPHLAVPGRDLQEGARAWAGRACHRAQRRRLLADVAGRRRAAPLRMAGRDDDRAAQCLVPPALQYGADAGALSRFQACDAAQRPGRSAVMDQPAARRRPRSTTPTRPRRCAGCSRTRCRSTPSFRAWTRSMPRKSPTCRPRRREPIMRMTWGRRFPICHAIIRRVKGSTS